MKKIIAIFFLSFCTLSTGLCQEKIKIKKEGGVYTIPCIVNGLKLRFVFDTGAADVSISAVEAAFMLKNDYLSESDFINSEQYLLADGSIEENAVINIKELKIGSVTLTNIRACVVKNISAPLLLGQSAISKLGKWYVDSNYLYLGTTVLDIFSENISDEECHAKATEFEKKGNLDEAYNLLNKLCNKNSKYNKELILFVLRNDYKKGMEHASSICLNACIAGDTAIISIMGRNYLELEPVDKNKKFVYYKTLYDKVAKFYAYELCEAYYDLHKPNVDAKEYATFLERAAKQTETYWKEMASDLYISLGVLYSKHPFYMGVINMSYDKEKSLRYFKKSIDLGNTEAMYRYGEELLHTENIDATTQKDAIFWLEKAASLESIDAISILFDEYYQGDKIGKNHKKCIDYGKKLLALSHNVYRFKANAILGMIYYDIKDYDNAVKHLQEANRNSDATFKTSNAYAILGDCYWFGQGTNKDYKKAYEMYMKELQLDETNTYIIWKLGYMCDNGIGTQEDKELAFECYKEGANLGDADCQSNLATCYYFGSTYGYPIKADFNKALYWSKKAIENSVFFPYVIMGWIYSDKNSSYYNLSKAIECYENASKNNIGSGSYLLGEIYETGRGHIQKNYKLAEKYYRLAVQQGYSEAKEKLSQFE